MFTPEMVEPANAGMLGRAVHRNPLFSRAGFQERLFTIAFRQLVYAQIWEDPVVDLKAMELTPEARIIAIASGGCNVMSYLAAGPAHITAIDLNPAHIALLRLKLAGAQRLGDHQTFRRFFGAANSRRNVDDYWRLLAGALPRDAKDYWEGRDRLGRRRISMFARGFHRHGLLGRFIGAGHLLSRLLGVDPRGMTTARTRELQERIYESSLAPLMRSRIVRSLTSSPAALFGLGIPPAQFSSLASGRTMADVLEERLRKLACDFDLKDNYFAWQAFARAYEDSPDASVPPYLEARHFEAVKCNADRVFPVNASLIDHLAGEPALSFDRYVLLDAQDWMDDAHLTRLWCEITRTARPGARVIFRTADGPSLLPGRIPQELLSRWRYEEARSEQLTREDRAAVYGGFHLYVLDDRHAA